MNSLFIKIRERIKNDAVLNDFYIDENYGQLDTETDFYPVTFPCILLDIAQIEWDNLVHGTQMGTCSVKVSLAIDCKDEEFDGSFDECIKKREAYLNRMHRLLHNFSVENYTPLIRKSFQTLSLPGSIKVYEYTFTCTLKEAATALDKTFGEPLSISIEVTDEAAKRFVLPD